jgi:hypothetical protein
MQLVLIVRLLSIGDQSTWADMAKSNQAGIDCTFFLLSCRSVWMVDAPCFREMKRTVTTVIFADGPSPPHQSRVSEHSYRLFCHIIDSISHPLAIPPTGGPSVPTGSTPASPSSSGSSNTSNSKSAAMKDNGPGLKYELTLVAVGCLFSALAL